MLGKKAAQLWGLYWFTVLIHEIGGHWKRWTYAQSDTPEDEEFWWNNRYDCGNRVELDVFGGYTVNLGPNQRDTIIAISEDDGIRSQWRIPDTYLNNVFFDWSAGIATVRKCIYVCIQLLMFN